HECLHSMSSASISVPSGSLANRAEHASWKIPCRRPFVLEPCTSPHAWSMTFPSFPGIVMALWNEEVCAMQCPLCHVSMPSETVVCPGCGTDLTVLLSLQTLQLDLQRVRDQSARVAVQLDHLQGQLDAVATLVQTTLTQMRPVSSLASAPASNAVAVPNAPSSAPPEAPSEAPSPALAPRAVVTEGAEVQVGQQWLLIAGIAITVLGIGFFLKYAFDQNWVGPGGRIILGYLAAVTFFGAGDVLRRRSGAAAFGLYLAGGGLATLYLTTYAAFELYALLGQV